jgi:hypothetical protein
MFLKNRPVCSALSVTRHKCHYAELGIKDIITNVCGCTRPAQPWPVFSACLNAYVLVFLANEGWFFSTSTDR